MPLTQSGFSEPDASVTVEKLEEDFAVAADRYLDSDEMGVDAIKATVAALTAVVGKLNDLVEMHDYDLIGPAQAAPTRPIVQRAAAVKKEIDEVKVCVQSNVNTQDMHYVYEQLISTLFLLETWSTYNL